MTQPQACIATQSGACDPGTLATHIFECIIPDDDSNLPAWRAPVCAAHIERERNMHDGCDPSQHSLIPIHQTVHLPLPFEPKSAEAALIAVRHALDAQGIKTSAIITCTPDDDLNVSVDITWGMHSGEWRGVIESGLILFLVKQP